MTMYIFKKKHHFGEPEDIWSSESVKRDKELGLVLVLESFIDAVLPYH